MSFSGITIKLINVLGRAITIKQKVTIVQIGPKEVENQVCEPNVKIALVVHRRSLECLGHNFGNMDSTGARRHQIKGRIKNFFCKSVE